MEKGQTSKNSGFLASLFEYSLKNGFSDAVRYLGINSKQLVSNLCFFVSLNLETKECLAFAHRRIKKSYLPFVLQNIREFASKTRLDLNPSEYLLEVLPDGKIIGDEGPAKPEFVFTVPVFVKGKAAVFLSFSKNDNLPPREEDISSLNLIVNFLSALKEREEREKLERENIEKLALIDSLTGTLNRRAFYQMFSQDISEMRRNGTIICLIVFDIDGFKQINDS